MTSTNDIAVDNSGIDIQRQHMLWKHIVAAYCARSHPEDAYMPVDELIRMIWLFASTKEVLKLLEIAFADGRIRCNPPEQKFAFAILANNFLRQSPSGSFRIGQSRRPLVAHGNNTDYARPQTDED